MGSEGLLYVIFAQPLDRVSQGLMACAGLLADVHPTNWSIRPTTEYSFLSYHLLIRFARGVRRICLRFTMKVYRAAKSA